MVGVHRSQQAAEHMMEDLQVRRARGEKLQLHGADLREEQHATPRLVPQCRKLAQPSKIHLHSWKKNHTQEVTGATEDMEIQEETTQTRAGGPLPDPQACPASALDTHLKGSS